MLRRSQTRRLLWFGMAVALVAHLWMLHDPMPAAGGGAGLAGSASAVIGVAESAPWPAGEEPGRGTQLMALTCLAVLAGATGVWLVARAWRSGAGGRRDVLTTLQTPLRRRVWQRPPVPGSSRVEAGVLLLV